MYSVISDIHLAKPCLLNLDASYSEILKLLSWEFILCLCITIELEKLPLFHPWFISPAWVQNLEFFVAFYFKRNIYLKSGSNWCTPMLKVTQANLLFLFSWFELIQDALTFSSMLAPFENTHFNSCRWKTPF